MNDVVPIESARKQPAQADPIAAHSLEAERSVLGALLISPAKLPLVLAAIPSVDEFLLPAHREVYAAMLAVAGRGRDIDPILVSDELESRGKLPMLDGGSAYLLDLANAVPTSENVGHYAEIVARKASIRALARNCAELAAVAETDPDHATSLVLASQRLVSDIAKGRRKPGVDVADLVVPVQREFRAREKNRGRVVGLSTGMPSIDWLMGGLIRKRVHVIAARPGIGKSAMCADWAITGAVYRDTPCLWASLEMSAEELMERFYARLANIDSSRLLRGQLDATCWDAIEEAGNVMQKPGRMTITEDMTLAGICSHARTFRIQHPGEIVIVVDYLQLMQVRHEKGESREREVAKISGALKALAKELDCAVVLVSQLNRKSEEEDRPPKLSDLRESGSIEQDADVVGFIHRDRKQASGTAWFQVAKHRGGATGEVEMKWHGPTYTFTEVGDARDIS